MSDYTAFLFARPSLLSGVARAFDISGALTEYNKSPDGLTADYLALLADWYAIGEDLKLAAASFELEHPTPRADAAAK